MKAKLLAIIDELKEKKIKLDNEIALLKSKREIATREYDLVIASLDESRKKLNEYNIMIGKLDDFVDAFIKEKDEIFKIGIETIEELFRIIEECKLISRKIEEKIEENLIKLNEFKEKEKTSMKRITEENERLSTMKEDLDIYRKRLEKKYEEFMPGQKIIL